MEARLHKWKVTASRSTCGKCAGASCCFVEVYLKCGIDECVRRDPKGLYKRALAGDITTMTGIEDPYEEPLSPEVLLDTEYDSSRENVGKVLRKIRELGYI